MYKLTQREAVPSNADGARRSVQKPPTLHKWSSFWQSEYSGVTYCPRNGLAKQDVSHIRWTTHTNHFLKVAILVTDRWPLRWVGQVIHNTNLTWHTHLRWCVPLLDVLAVKHEPDAVLAHSLSIAIRTHQLLKGSVLFQFEMDNSSVLRDKKRHEQMKKRTENGWDWSERILLRTCPWTFRLICSSERVGFTSGYVEEWHKRIAPLKQSYDI